jgi:hypothetical protein
MRAIAADFFLRSPLMAGPQIAMVIFLVIFLLVTWRVLRSRSSEWETAARMPLMDGTTGPGEKGHE